ncbi:MAG: leucine-rich repeat domain-containing protein [Muribaculaceae bacterium]|nr:leucine-rich repeat domain-containing protein [Muribaculaceae bacterium]
MIKYAKPYTLKTPTGGNVITINYDVYDSRIEDGFVYTRNKRTVYFAPTQLPDDYALPETVKTISNGAFAYSDFQSVSLGNSLTTIGDYAFRGCSDLKSLRLGSSVSQIGSGAWNDCESIETIECSMPTPFAAPKDIFPLNVYDNATLYVPEGSMDKYMEVAPWSYFYNIKEGLPVNGIDDIVAAGGDDTIDCGRPYDV